MLSAHNPSPVSHHVLALLSPPSFSTCVKGLAEKPWLSVWLQAEDTEQDINCFHRKQKWERQRTYSISTQSQEPEEDIVHFPINVFHVWHEMLHLMKNWHWNWNGLGILHWGHFSFRCCTPYFSWHVPVLACFRLYSLKKWTLKGRKCVSIFGGPIGSLQCIDGLWPDLCGCVEAVQERTAAIAAEE